MTSSCEEKYCTTTGALQLPYLWPYCAQLEGDISDQSRGRFDPGLSVPQVGGQNNEGPCWRC